MIQFFSIGEMVIDFLPGDEPGVYIRKAGGAPANVAIALARQGIASGFLGMVGEDDFGRFLHKTLEENGVRVLCPARTKEATTTMAFVTLDEQGDRSFTFARKPGADMLLTKAHVRDAFFDEAIVVHAGSCSLSKGTAADATAYALREGRRRNKLVSFDVNYRNLLWDDDREAAARAVREILPCVDLLKISQEEADMIGGEEVLPATMRQNDVALVVETLGADGARCFWKDERIELPGLRADCVDTTGAGDAFWGGFLASLLDAGVRTTGDLTRRSIENALRTGNIAGWLCVQKKGAIESLPTKAEVSAHFQEFYT